MSLTALYERAKISIILCDLKYTIAVVMAAMLGIRDGARHCVFSG